MPLRVIGPRVLLKPVTPKQASEVIHLTDRVPPTIGRVVGIGTDRCPDCEALHTRDLQIGDVVVIPAAAGQEVTVDGAEHWIVPIDAVLSYWQPEPTQSIDSAVRDYMREHWIEKKETHA